MEILTDYDYTIDVTSDAGGAPETFGEDAGFGIISADQMLAWVAANCQESCAGVLLYIWIMTLETVEICALYPHRIASIRN